MKSEELPACAGRKGILHERLDPEDASGDDGDHPGGGYGMG